jgi:putative membrane protein
MKITDSDRRNIDTFKLALHRTELANRRTFLAYLKTAIALCASGVALLHLLDNQWMGTVGWVLLPISLFVLMIGIADYQRVKKSIDEEKHDGGL